MTDTYVTPGQLWRQLGDSAVWRVLSVEPDGLVTLTGPGPARSLLHVVAKDLVGDWEIVDL